MNEELGVTGAGKVQMDQIQAASKMAGEWWAERLSDSYDEEQRAAFKEAVAKRVGQTLRKECYWNWSGEKIDGVHPFQPMVETEFDYEPHFCLCEALEESIPGMSVMDLKECLPMKHELGVYAEILVPKEGYGNWTAKIPVPPVVTPNVRGKLAPTA